MSSCRAASRTVVGLVVVLLAAVLAACGSGSPTPQTPQASGDGAFPVTLQHKYGSTTIPAAPKRIVALSFEQDLLGQLGIATVGRTDNEYDAGQPYPWQVGTVDLRGSTPVVDKNGQVDLERLAALAPDLILATNFYGNDQYYQRLSRIAPTVAWPTGLGQTSWQDTAAIIGRAVGREADAKAVVDRTEAYLNGLRTALPGLQGKTYGSGYYYETGTFVISAGPDAQSSKLRSAIGLQVAPALTAAFPQGRGTLSTERIGLLNADLLLIGFATPQLQSELQANPLYTGLAPVRAGHVAAVDQYVAAAGNNPTTLNIPWQFDRIRPVLEKVATGR